jgi:NhaP-type Na+/H+ or K+/H+ antiporter
MMVFVRPAVEILALVIAVAVVAGAARRAGMSAPLVLGVVVASLVPGVPEYRLDPEIVLIGVLPPLLCAAALRTSLVDVSANRQAIGILAVGAVIFTTVVVGLVAWMLLPKGPGGAANLLGSRRPEPTFSCSAGQQRGMGAL